MQHYEKALSQLNAACSRKRYDDLQLAGLVQMFEFTFELAWKTLQDLLFYEGYTVNTPREVIRQAFVAGYLTEEDTELFLDSLLKRNLLSHTYEPDTALEAKSLIRKQYAPLLQRVFTTLDSKRRQ